MASYIMKSEFLEALKKKANANSRTQWKNIATYLRNELDNSNLISNDTETIVRQYIGTNVKHSDKLSYQFNIDPEVDGRLADFFLLWLSKLLNVKQEDIALTSNTYNKDKRDKKEITEQMNYTIPPPLNNHRPNFDFIPAADTLKFRARLAELIRDAQEEIVWVKREYLAVENTRPDGSNFDLDPEYKSIYEVIFLLLASMKGLFNSKRKSVRITFIYYAQQSVLGNKHLCFLHGLGVNVIVKNANNNMPPFEGIISDPNRNESAKMIFRNAEWASKAHNAKYLFFDEKSQAIILHFYKHIEKELHRNKVIQKVARIKNHSSFEKYYNKLRLVKGYERARFSVINNLRDWLISNSDKLFVHQTSIKKHKLIQLEAITLTMQEDSVTFDKPSYFELIGHSAESPKYKVINPPIIEKRDSNWHLIDGSTRLYYANKHDYLHIDRLPAIEVVGCIRDLPTTPIKWSQIAGFEEKAIVETGSDHEPGKRADAREIDKFTFDVDNWKEWYADFFKDQMEVVGLVKTRKK